MISLKRKDGCVVTSTKNGVSVEIPVSINWMRPITGVGKEISILNENEEIAVIDDIEMLDSQSQEIVIDEIKKKYLYFNIEKIIKTEVYLGNRYFDVITNRGRYSFIIKNPFVSIRKYKENGLYIKDVVGNIFIIDSIDKLDRRSNDELSKIR